jgi:hypothetical protein
MSSFCAPSVNVFVNCTITINNGANEKFTCSNPPVTYQTEQNFGQPPVADIQPVPLLYLPRSMNTNGVVTMEKMMKFWNSERIYGIR